MYEKITAYLETFSSGAAPEDKIKAFAADFMESGLMNPNAMEAMGSRVMASKTALKNEAPTMSGEEICVCISAFVQQDMFIPGILTDLVSQGVIPQMLKRLQELDS